VFTAASHFQFIVNYARKMVPEIKPRFSQEKHGMPPPNRGYNSTFSTNQLLSRAINGYG
jgi:hypothetical protein